MLTTFLGLPERKFLDPNIQHIRTSYIKIGNVSLSVVSGLGEKHGTQVGLVKIQIKLEDDLWCSHRSGIILLIFVY